MSMTMQVNRSAVLGGKTFSLQKSVTGETVAVVEKSVPAAKVGALTTRTSATVGELTMAASHGITTGALLDIYWDVGGVKGSRRQVTVGTVATLAVPFSGGSGDDLPADESAITAAVPISEPIGIPASGVKGLAFYSEKFGTLVLAGADDAEDYAVRLQDGMSDSWFDGDTDYSPILGDVITQVFLSHADSSQARTMRVAALSS